MEIQKQELVELISTVVKETIAQLGLVNGSANPKTTPAMKEKTAYAKTEALLYNYNGFQRIIKERMDEIEEIKKYGVPKKGEAVKQYGGGGSVSGLVLPEESVESAVRRIEESIKQTIHAVNLIDRGMAALSSDPYYGILRMRYFEGRTQEDIAFEMKCSQVNISKNNSRLVRELSFRLFPDQSVSELLN